MATLVLTAVGTAVAGPIGGAIGSLFGQVIDETVLFRPARREGPRLTDLSVQTSSYGTPIAQLFGRSRVAGCVIWSTDLIETSGVEGGGKGQAGVTRYSYAASFAVALSSRPIRGVGRIWADGNLVRGAAGDWTVAATMRLHLGGEDQTADPLIASAEGIAMAPAHRGIAYAVFETLPLESFGNRIPSLTFEVFADEMPPTSFAVAGALAPDVVDAGAGGAALTGFSAYGTSRRAVLDTLQRIDGGWVRPDGDRVTTVPVGPAEMVLDDAGWSARGTGATGVRSAAAIETVPRSLSVGHYDPDRDYQIGQQRARRPGAGWGAETIDLPAVMPATEAKLVAETLLLGRDAARERRTLALPLSAMAVPPGARVAITGEAGIWRASGWSLEGGVVSLDLVRLARRGATAPVATSGRVLSPPDDPAGTTVIAAAELPGLSDAPLSAPRLMVAAAGTGAGWRPGAISYSLDDGASWSRVAMAARAAVIGRVTDLPGGGAGPIEDRATVLEVEILSAAADLSGADAQRLAAGANLALVGDELLQFGTAEPMGERRWRLSGLWRGRRGTEAAIGTQAAGDRFVLLSTDCVAAIDLPLSAIGREVRVMAQGVGDAEPVEVRARVDGVSILPPSPVHLTITGSEDGRLLRWVRRSRSGWAWIDGIEAPLGEESEAYVVALADGTIVTTADAGLPVGPTGSAAVRQRGTFGCSPAADLSWER